MGYFGGNGGYLKRKQPKNLWLDVGCLKKRNFAKVSERYFLTTVNLLVSAAHHGILP
ncbi:hypothetical protein EEF61_11840, partial [Neisseria gonorrhoeae]